MVSASLLAREIQPALLIINATHFFLGFFVMLFLVAFVRDFPPTPPSVAESSRTYARNNQNSRLTLSLLDNDGLISHNNEMNSTHTTTSDQTPGLQHVWNDVKTIFRDKHAMLLVSAFALGMIIGNTVITLPRAIIDPCLTPDSSINVGDLTGYFIFAGIGGCVVFSIALILTKSFKVLLKVGYSLASIAVVLFLCFLSPNLSSSNVSLLFAMLGFFMLPLLPLTLETMAECTYPIQEHTGAALALCISQLPSIPFIILFQTQLSQSNYTECSRLFGSQFGITVLCIVGVASTLGWLYRGENKRLLSEQEQHMIQHDDVFADNYAMLTTPPNNSRAQFA